MANATTDTELRVTEEATPRKVLERWDKSTKVHFYRHSNPTLSPTPLARRIRTTTVGARGVPLALPTTKRLPHHSSIKPRLGECITETGQPGCGLLST